MLRLVAVITLVAALGACGDDDADDVAREAEETAQQAGEAVQDAWASLRTDAERLVDEIRTRNDPEAKDQLLDRCRGALEELRQAESPDADRMAALCDRIQDTDVGDRDAWSDVEREISELNPTG
ncbi:MAG TPA: hypothetical protein VM263_07005 [Acidimicrobiales bacterium]|nr:hypothetical protein [Acidimicrobiales bacterium]